MQTQPRDDTTRTTPIYASLNESGGATHNITTNSNSLLVYNEDEKDAQGHHHYRYYMYVPDRNELSAMSSTGRLYIESTHRNFCGVVTILLSHSRRMVYIMDMFMSFLGDDSPTKYRFGGTKLRAFKKQFFGIEKQYFCGILREQFFGLDWHVCVGMQSRHLRGIKRSVMRQARQICKDGNDMISSVSKRLLPPWFNDNYGDLKVKFAATQTMLDQVKCVFRDHVLGHQNSSSSGAQIINVQ